MVALGVLKQGLGDAMGTVLALVPKERLRQDAEPIAAIYRNLGTQAAEQVVTRALAELALMTAGLSRQVVAGDVEDLVRQLRRLQRMAQHLGMVSFATIAGDARMCMEAADGTGFAAVWARLLRVAERSLASDQDLIDQSI
jgi:diphthamide synthase (EF-2-diphthine--ammonia ligase)